MMRGARGIFALALPSLLFLTACTGSNNPYQLGVSKLDVPLPHLSGSTLAGGDLGPTQLRGKVLVVNFWASWCGPCRDEQPALQALSKRFASRGVQFLGVDERDNLAQAKAWVREFGVTYPSIVDQAGSFADDFAFWALPITYVVDRGGTIRFKIFGATDELQLGGVIDNVIGQP